MDDRIMKMEENEAVDADIEADVGKFVESYASFNKVVNKIQRQYLTLKETYTRQSEELQAVNKTLQSLMKENRAVTEFLNSILSSLSSGVIAIDNNGNISHMNPAARKILGVDEKELNFGDLLYSDVMQPIEKPECSALEALRQRRNVENEEMKVKTRLDTAVTLSVSSSLLKNRGGEVIGIVEMFQDVSKLKRMEEQIAQMKVLASLGEIAASIAHEVRNPLSGIGGFASLLARDLEDDPDKKEMADKIVEGVVSINNTIQTLLDFARREKLEKTTVNLDQYLNILLDEFKEMNGFKDAGNRIQQNLRPERRISVELDRRLFRQVIFNFIKNGLEAGGDNGYVKITTKTMPLSMAQKEYGDGLQLSGTETLAEILIEDNGSGIDEEHLEKLFSPFYSSKDNGIGLGLSIAWKIIKAHGGDVNAESHLGKGTKFSIVLPAKTG